MCSKQATLLSPLYTTCLQEHCDHLLLVYWRLPAAAKRKRGCSPCQLCPKAIVQSTTYSIHIYIYIYIKSGWTAHLIFHPYLYLIVL